MMELDVGSDEVRCSHCLEVRSKIADRFAVVLAVNSEGDEKPEIWCQECADKLKTAKTAWAN